MHTPPNADSFEGSPKAWDFITRLDAFFKTELEPLAQQLLAFVDQALLVAAELAGAGAHLHRLAEGHVPDGTELAEVAALLGGLIFQQLAAEAAVSGFVFPFPQADRKSVV